MKCYTTVYALARFQNELPGIIRSNLY